jgi:hypothetical protein
MRTTPIVTHKQASAPTYSTVFTSLQSSFLQQIHEEQHILGLYVALEMLGYARWASRTPILLYEGAQLAD